MEVPDVFFDLSDLCEQAGVTPRTVRYYIQQGLLPQPGAGREARKYGEGYLNRLRLIRRLQREHLPLAEIRQRLAGLGDDEVAELLEPATSSTGAAPSARDYLNLILGPRTPAAARALARESDPISGDYRLAKAASLTVPPARPPAGTPKTSPVPVAEHWPRGRDQWERLTLHEDVELHVRRPTSRDMNRRIERLLEAARRILNDD